MATFIAIPLKKTVKIDLINPLKQVFSEFFITPDEPINFDNALNELNKLRIDSTCGTSDKHESLLDILTRYYDQLNFLDCRCPNIEFQIPFKWEDAFNKSFLGSSSLTLSTLTYEKICVLFNIGSIQSHLACSHVSDSKNDENLKLAAKYFQMASGTFEYLKSQTPVIKDPTPDLQLDTLSALQALMLAQAQESFFYKATSDSMKDSIVAKVASQCSDLYADAFKLMQKESILHIWKKNSLLLVSGKHESFCALAEYYQSLVCKSKKDFGEEIARLQQALALMKAANLKGSQMTDLKDYVQKMTRNYSEAKKENDLLYHARIPDVKSLPPIGKAALAKPILPGEKLNLQSQDLFFAEIQLAVSEFIASKRNILNEEKLKMQSEAHKLNRILTSLNLPKALEETTENYLLSSLCDKAKVLQEQGGVQALQKLFEKLSSHLQQNKEILQESKELLSQRQMAPGEQSAFEDSLRRFSEVMGESAHVIDKKKFGQHKEKMGLLCMAPPVLPKSAARQRLQLLLREVDTLTAEREALTRQLDKDMGTKYLSESVGTYAEALSVDMGDYFQNVIQSKISRQKQLRDQIQNANSAFSKEKNEIKIRQNILLRDLSIAYDVYMELSKSLEERSKANYALTKDLLDIKHKIESLEVKENKGLLQGLTEGIWKILF